SENTRRTYETGWNSWVRWAAANGIRRFTATSEHIRQWLAALYMKGKKISTLRTYLAAVAYKLRSRRGPNPARHSWVRMLLAGLARHAARRGITARQADPLRSEHIEGIIDAAPAPRRNQPGGRLETPEQAQKRADIDIAMIVVAHDGLLRCSETLALKWVDVEFSENGGPATIWITRSKADQHAKGAAVPISEFAARALARIRPEDAHPGDRIFGFSPSTARRRYKAAALAAGISPAHISTHSTRIGMAQDLAAKGTDIGGIMLAGRWKNHAITLRYIQRLQAQHTPAAQYLNHQLFPNSGEPEPSAKRGPSTPADRPRVA
ncbi:MAG: tyrosine-type recombinase/integrase, partial [Acidimicrobiia bacterium]|nr:tyrosine-type recombinase/integrase [Acidimicrobiia bacterium]